MKFTELFGKATARWIKYSEYDAEPFNDAGRSASPNCSPCSQGDEWYIMPTKDAVPFVYDPIENIEEIVVEALNIGLKFMSTEKEFFDDSRMVAEMCVFAEKYGLLGFMTAFTRHA